MSKPTKLEEYKGLWMHAETPQEVKDILARYYAYGRRPGGRLRMIYGDAVTGKAWITQEEVRNFGVRSAGAEGYIGRSTGSQKIPLEIVNSRSMGGGAILDNCIVRIEEAKGKFLLYTHPSFHWTTEQEQQAAIDAQNQKEAERQQQPELSERDQSIVRVLEFAEKYLQHPDVQAMNTVISPARPLALVRQLIEDIKGGKL